MEKLVQNGLINENIPKHLQLVLKKPTGESRQNSVIIVVKNITSQLLFIEEANEILKNLPINIKQEICAMSNHNFQIKLRKYMFDRTLAKLLSLHKLDGNVPFEHFF